MSIEPSLPPGFVSRPQPRCTWNTGDRGRRNRTNNRPVGATIRIPEIRTVSSHKRSWSCQSGTLALTPDKSRFWPRAGNSGGDDCRSNLIDYVPFNPVRVKSAKYLAAGVALGLSANSMVLFSHAHTPNCHDPNNMGCSGRWVKHPLLEALWPL